MTAASAFQANRALLNGAGATIEVALRASGRASLPRELLDFARRVARSRHLPEGVDGWVVGGYNRDTGRTETVNLLNALLLSKKLIMRQDPDTRALNRESAYAAIESAYDELRDQIAIAAAGAVWESLGGTNGTS